MWDKITVGQFQAAYKIWNDTTMEDIDRAQNLISIFYNMTLAQVDDLALPTFNKLSVEAMKLLNVDDIPGKPVRVLKANGKKYGIIYKVHSLRHRQYVEAMAYGDKPIENMHLIMASLVQPINWLGKWGRNEGANHKLAAEDLQQARLIDIYHSCVFFCKLYLSSIESIKPYLVRQMMDKGIPENQATELLNLSKNTMAGLFLPKKWQPLKV